MVKSSAIWKQRSKDCLVQIWFNNHGLDNLDEKGHTVTKMHPLIYDRNCIFALT